MGSTQVVDLILFSMFPSILTYDFDLILGLFLHFWSPKGLFLGSGYDSYSCWIYSCSWTTFIFCDSLNCDIRIWLDFVERFDNCFGVYSWSWTTFILYVSLILDIWFWLNFWIIFIFRSPCIGKLSQKNPACLVSSYAISNQENIPQ